MPIIQKTPLFAVLCIAVTGCAYVNAKAIRPGEPVPDGIIVATKKPVMVIEDGAMRIEEVPNTSQGYALRYGAFLAKNDTVVSLNNDGTLQSINSKLDSEAALDALTKAAESFAPPDRGVVQDDAKQAPRSPKLEIFDFVFAEDGTIRCLAQIYPPVSRPAPCPG